MKASLKFREEQKPLVRAKIPLSVLGLPFLSGVSAGGDSKDLTLNLSTHFHSGPTLKLSYRPNDPTNPFSLSLKTGVGPISSAPLSISAHFNLLRPSHPSFILHLSPRLGDFSLHKLAPSPSPLHKNHPDSDGSLEGPDTPPSSASYLFPALPRPSAALVAGAEVRARTSLPLRNIAVLTFRWGLRLPPSLRGAVFPHDDDDDDGGGGGRFPPPPMFSSPTLVMGKISIEHVPEADRLRRTPLPDEAESFDALRRQLEAVQAENGLLRRAVDEISSEVFAGKTLPAAATLSSGKRDRSLTGKSPETSGLAGKVIGEEVNEEVKKA